jgi:hypothetical protein
MRRTLRTSNPNATNEWTLKRQSGIGREALTSGESPQLTLSKKSKEHSRSDETSENSSRRISRGNLFGDVPDAVIHGQPETLTHVGLAVVCGGSRARTPARQVGRKSPRQVFRSF